MELYIRMRDGIPFEHPILGDNFRQAFPHIDTNHLPPEFMRFIRVAPPVVKEGFEIAGVTYEIVDGVVTDVFHIQPVVEK